MVMDNIIFNFGDDPVYHFLNLNKDTMKFNILSKLLVLLFISTSITAQTDAKIYDIIDNVAAERIQKMSIS